MSINSDGDPCSFGVAHISYPSMPQVAVLKYARMRARNGPLSILSSFVCIQHYPSPNRICTPLMIIHLFIFYIPLIPRSHIQQIAPSPRMQLTRVVSEVSSVLDLCNGAYKAI